MSAADRLRLDMNDFLLEIGTEEIPAGYIQAALDALAGSLINRLAETRIDHGAVSTYGSPRRLVVRINGIAARQKAVTEQVMGPPERIAFDDQGRPSVPAVKFAEKVGLPVERLAVKETEKGRYLTATVTDRGVASKTVLQRILPEIILATPFPKAMRWSNLTIAFARPIQSVLALLGKSVVSFALADKLKSGRYAWGHMFMHRKKVKIDQPDDYLPKMRQSMVIADIPERREMVLREIAAAAESMGGRILPDEELVDIVTHLVEIPIATGGRFDEGFLELPREILITAMREHQKYFAVVAPDGSLMPCFVAVNNTRTKDLGLVAKGHERVLRARLSDARFFFQADLKEKMEDRRERLKGVLFQAKLGSMHAKVQRVVALGAHLSASESQEIQSHVQRAAMLCKADLVSQVVGEFPKLQGIMGRVYAAAAGEPGDVATAIEEHYRPVYSGGVLPQTRTGAILAIADKLDSICGCFHVGLVPTGASDPYALRRQCIGIVQTILAQNLDISLKAAIDFSLRQFEAEQKTAAAEAVTLFFQSRIARILAEEGFDKDIVAAVTSVSIDNIPDVWKRTRALQALKGAPDFEPLAAAFKRVVNILRKAQGEIGSFPDKARFQEPSETALFDAYDQVKIRVGQKMEGGDLEGALRVIASLRSPVDRFFDDVMVMTDDLALRGNRLALLNAIAGLFDRMADFSKIYVA
jgi:glycyl-tRNA synthetase beta chain